MEPVRSHRCTWRYLSLVFPIDQVQHHLSNHIVVLPVSTVVQERGSAQSDVKMI